MKSMYKEYCENKMKIINTQKIPYKRIAIFIEKKRLSKVNPNVYIFFQV